MEELATRLTEPFYAISEQIAFDVTIFIQLVVFVALYLAMKPLLWTPFLAKLDERHALTVGNKEQAESEEAEVLQLQAQYETAIREARLAASEERTRIRNEAQQRERVLVAEARSEAAGIIDGLRADVSRAADEARSGLQGEADAIAQAMTEKLLGRSV